MNEQPNKKGKSKLTGFFEEKGFYIILFLCVVAIGITGYVFFFSNPATDTEGDANDAALIDTLEDWENTEANELTSIPVYDGDDAGAAQASVLDVDAGDSAEPDTEASQTEPAKAASAEASEAVVEPEAEPAKAAAKADFFVKPVSGAVLTVFSADELVYDRTMGDWRTHNGTDFEATDGEKVMVIADGTVEDIYTDSYYGTCVLVDHGDGLKSMYAGLIQNATVTIGQKVTAGTVIGAIDGKALFENADPVHLHVEVFKNDKRIDPLSVIPS